MTDKYSVLFCFITYRGVLKCYKNVKKKKSKDKMLDRDFFLHNFSIHEPRSRPDFWRTMVIYVMSL